VLRSMRAVAGLLLLALVFAPGAARAADDPLAKLFGGPFELIDHSGAARTDKSFRGRFLLIYFGYTSCPDICPTNLATIGAALDELGETGDAITPLFISIDPARDELGLLEGYVKSFHPRMIGLTGSEQQIQAVSRAYRIHRRKIPQPDADPKTDYLVDHSSITYLVGPDGTFRTLFPHDTKLNFMVRTIRKYLGQG